MMIRPFSGLDIIPSMNCSGQRLKKNEQDIMRYRGSTHVFYSHSRTLSYSCIETQGTLCGCNSNHITTANRDHRVIEPVVEQLIEWAAAALETTCNQPILPYAIIVLNASEQDINPLLWDVDFATNSLLESLAETVDRTPAFVRHAKFWRDRHKDIQSLKDLILCYYSDLRVCSSYILQ